MRKTCMSGKLRKRYLKRLHTLQNGICALCLRPTALGFECLAVGWVLDSLGYNLYSPDQMQCVPLATLDHIQRVRHGGSNDIGNLRLTCAECNHERN